MKISVKKTDLRHTAGDRYFYYVVIKPDEYLETNQLLEKFYELRAWCWETWGPSREANERPHTETSWQGDNNQHWSWICDQHRARIYLARKSDAAYFALKWS